MLPSSKFLQSYRNLFNLYVNLYGLKTFRLAHTNELMT